MVDRLDTYIMGFVQSINNGGQSRQIDFMHMFQYELASVPYAFSHLDGTQEIQSFLSQI